MRPLARVVWGTMRPPVILLLVLYAATGTAVGGATTTAVVLQALLVVLPFLACSAVLNDLADERIDRVNLPADAQRVLAAGEAHRRHLWAVALLAAAGTLGAAATLGPAALAVAAAGLAVSSAYSLDPVRLSARGMVAPLALPACYVAVPYLVGVLSARGHVRVSDLPLLAALYVGFIGRIILKDFRDVRGDALFGKRTFLVRRGRVSTCRVSAAFWSAGTALLLWARPGATTAYVLSTLAGSLLALLLLHELAAGRGHRRDEWLISALAIVGRGLLLVLVVDLAAPAAGWSTALTTAVIGGFMVSFGGQALHMRGHGPSLPVGRASSGPAAGRGRGCVPAGTGEAGQDGPVAAYRLVR